MSFLHKSFSHVKYVFLLVTIQIVKVKGQVGQIVDYTIR